MNFLLFLLYLVPKNILSHYVGKLVHIRLPEPLGSWSVRTFASYYKIRLQEAERPVAEYKSIGELFTRFLKPGLRSIGDAKIVHPADSRISQTAKIKDGFCIQAKNKNYSIHDFSQDPEAMKKWGDGRFATYYLCPTDYHRVHSPVSGKITQVTYVPGALWPVNEWSTTNIDKLFAVNERVCIEIETDLGPVLLVMVGATNVGKMTLAFDKELITNQFHQSTQRKTYQALSIKKGDEVGVFHMGSTVVMLYPASFEEFTQKLRPGTVLMGQNFDQFLD